MNQIIPIAYDGDKLASFGALVDGTQSGPFMPGPLSRALAQINRYTGQTNAPFSVAAHSVLTANIAAGITDHDADDAAAIAALHDAHECVIGDIGAPFIAFAGPRFAGMLESIKTMLDLRIFALYGVKDRPGAAWASARADKIACDAELSAIFGIDTDRPTSAIESRAMLDAEAWIRERAFRSTHEADRIARDRDEFLRVLARLDGVALTLPA